MKTKRKIIATINDLKIKKISVEELVGESLKNIKQWEPKVNAFITVCEKEAQKEAQKVDDKIAKAKNLEALMAEYPLLGIPLALKDLFSTAGIKTTAGSKVLADYVPYFDATVVQKLKKAGAIIIGKTNLDAWAHGSSGENSDFEPTKNPHDLKLVAGGSSSGSAVALATGEALMATGTDTGGSIRLPASFCGVVGLKPTYGRVSRYGIIAMASSLDSVGHFTADVADSAYVLKVTAGQDPLDTTTSPLPVPDYRKYFSKKLKIGLPKEYFSRGVDKRIVKLIQKTIEKTKLDFVEVSLPHTEYAVATYYIIQPSEVSSNLARFDGIRFGHSRGSFGPEAKRRIMLGTYTLSSGYFDAYYLKAMKVRTLIAQDFRKVFEKVDLLACPISPSLPFPLGEKANDPLKMYLSDALLIAVNLAGLPAISIPVGFLDHLPVGMQLIAPQFAEAKLFQTGKIIEEIVE